MLSKEDWKIIEKDTIKGLKAFFIGMAIVVMCIIIYNAWSFLF